MVTHTLNFCSAFNQSKCTHTVVNTHTHTVNTHPEQWAAIYAAAPRQQLGVWCLAQGSHLSRGIEGGRERWLFTPKSKWLDNWDCLSFGGIKKKRISIIVGWLYPKTAKTHLYANKDMFHPMSPLKYNNLNSSDKIFWKSDSNQCWVLL